MSSVNKTSIKDVQEKILYIMKYIDRLCREKDIEYFIMGGTALGAVRHGGFIPWDDDLDIFMTPENYKKFKIAFNEKNDKKFFLQEWKTTPDFLEYAKVRLNGTTFIEDCFKYDKKMHHGIYVDIMILHKCPDKKIIQKSLYFKCKYVTLYALSKRNWKPKTKIQKILLFTLKFMPNKFLIRNFYKAIYKYDYKNLDKFRWFYWITPAKFYQGLFNKEFFENPTDIIFEGCKLLASRNIVQYLEYRYGDYKILPPINKRVEAIHAIKYDTTKDYKEYIK